MIDYPQLKKICKLIRHDILSSTTQAQSGHATSSLSAVELMAVLFFSDFYRYDLEHPENPANDRFILSKGHASPLLYALYHSAGAIPLEELMTLRTFDSNLEGHPTPRFKYVDVATGSLGQGLSIGVGMALGVNLKFKTSDLKLDRIPNVYVLLGDSEMAEGQVWEAMQIAAHYKLSNLTAIVDINRLGQRGETMLGWDIETYAKRAQAFGWQTYVIDDGHDLKQVFDIYDKAIKVSKSSSELVKTSFNQLRPASQELQRGEPISTNCKPVMILAKTIKGKGISFLENTDGWHGKAIPKEKLAEALKELGEINLKTRIKIIPPKFETGNLGIDNNVEISDLKSLIQNLKSSNASPYKSGQLVSTREAYGDALTALGENDNRLVALDAEVSNSTYSDRFAKKFPERFFEMFIAEQNMISAALGLSKLGYIPFVSTFAAFLTRGFDQIRMAQYSFVKNSDKSSKIVENSKKKESIYNDLKQFKTNFNLNIVGSHAGVSIGKDGPSQMGLEDFAMFRSILNSVVLCGSDATSTFKLTALMQATPGIKYLRTMREKYPVIYSPDEKFKIGGLKIVRQTEQDQAVVLAVGNTVHEALKAAEELKKEQISICVVDVYSIKPLDEKTISGLAAKYKNIIVVEDHYPFGGLGEAISSLLTNFKFKIPNLKLAHLCVRKPPRSGSPEELLRYEEIDSTSIIKKVKELASI